MIGITNSAEPGKTTLVLANTNLEDHGTKLATWDSLNGAFTNASEVPPVETMWYHDTGGDMMERKTTTIAGMKNNGQDGTDNRLTLDYSIVFGNIVNNVYKNAQYYISSGVVVSDYFNEV